nr:MAG TPA: hypothetical protein [Caudoviricetes sp.]
MTGITILLLSINVILLYVIQTKITSITKRLWKQQQIQQRQLEKLLEERRNKDEPFC